MFRPNQRCRIRLAGETDVHGQTTPGPVITERCSIVRLMVSQSKSSVRADSSASRGAAHELQADAVILMTVTTKARIEDMVEFAGAKFKISGRFPRHDANGRLDHIEIHATIWSGA